MVFAAALNATASFAQDKPKTVTKKVAPAGAQMAPATKQVNPNATTAKTGQQVKPAIKPKPVTKPGTIGPAPKNPPLKYSKPTPYVPKEPENAPKKTAKPAGKKKPVK